MTITYDKINNLLAHVGPLQEELTAAFERVLSSGWFSLGPEVDGFETEFAAYCGVNHCIGAANGTDALELVLRGLGVAAGNEVITVANAGAYSTSAIFAIGAVPVYADVDDDTLLMTAESVAEKISSATSAVIVTHLFGRLADMESLCVLSDKHKIFLIEDCAQAHGAKRDGKCAGSWGDGAAFSFYPTKNLGALGDGGAVVTDDWWLAERIRRLRQYGWVTKYMVADRGGRNSRLDELQAAFLRVQLAFLDSWNQQRREIAACYNKYLKNSLIRKPLIGGSDFIAHLYVVRTALRDDLQIYLKKCRVANDIHYPLLDYQQPPLKKQYSGVRLPVSERAVKEVLSLPCYPEMSLLDVEKVSNMINEWQG